MIAIKLPIIAIPKVKPTSGELTIGINTFQSMPLFSVQTAAVFDHINTSILLPPAAKAAPHKPPIKAWLEEDGNPKAQVIRFQIIAPVSAQINISELILTMPVSTNPDEIVLATAVPEKAPTKLVIAASITACVGVKTFVATTVAIEFAVS